MSTPGVQPSASSILDALMRGSIDALSEGMPLGGSSSIAGLSTPSNVSIPTTQAIGNQYKTYCILQVAAKAMEIAVSDEYKLDTLDAYSVLATAVINSGLVTPSDVGVEARLDASQKIRVLDLDRVSEVFSRMISKSMVFTFYNAAIQKSTISESVASEYLEAVVRTTVARAGDKGTELGARMNAIVSNFGGCAVLSPPVTVAIPSVASYGGKDYKDLSADEVTIQEPDAKPMPWSSSRTRSFAGFGVLIEMVDSADRTSSIKKADGSQVYGVQFNISPETLTVNSVQVINRMQTMASWVEEHWGTEIDQVSFAGKSFSFNVTNDGDRYLAVDSRRNSYAYRELRELLKLYQTNGLVLQGPSVYAKGRAMREFYSPESQDPTRKILSHPRTGMVKERLYVRLTFANIMTCTGYFESIEVTEDAQNPYQMSYNVNFKSEMTKYLIGRTAP